MTHITQEMSLSSSWIASSKNVVKSGLVFVQVLAAALRMRAPRMLRRYLFPRARCLAWIDCGSVSGISDSHSMPS